MNRSTSRISLVFLAPLLGPAAFAQVTQRVSLDSNGIQGDGFSNLPSISADGRFVAFMCDATNLIPGDMNMCHDILVRDRRAGDTQRVSVDSSGIEGNNGSHNPAISADGRYVAFSSQSTNLVAGDTNASSDVFVHDRLTDTTERVSLATGGAQGNGRSQDASISADGRYVAFTSQATNLVPGDTNGKVDVFVRDRQSGVTGRVSVGSSGAQGNGDSAGPSISADGRFVAFVSWATALAPGDANGTNDVFLRDRQLGTTARLSVSTGGGEANSGSGSCSISADGRFVAFDSGATNLVVGDTNGFHDVFVRDRLNGTTERVSVGTNGAAGDGDSFRPSISADGRHVAFSSHATNLEMGDDNGFTDVYLRDRRSGTTERVSVATGGAEGNADSYDASISADGRFVAFASEGTNLAIGDSNGITDVFVRDRIGGTSFRSFCSPGVGGVMACPCSNAPGGTDRGCDNSSVTGGAALSASGGTFLSSDSLVFTTSGERPIALSILLQWTGTSTTGTAFGMGVRCTSGTFKRLYTKQAFAGSITAPDFAGGNPQVSVRSAALGDVILSGESRWYFVYYRDPIVLGGCPATSTFNATQTGQISWSP